MTAPPSRTRAPIALASACALAGCSGAPAQPPRPAEAAQPSADAAGAAYASPARWSYHPAAPDAAVAWAPFAGGGCVVVAPGGQRWTVTPDPRGAESPPSAAGPAALRCAGQGRTSAAPAPEELTAIVRRSPVSWMFIGASGAIYEASSPLGQLTRALSPPEPLLQVAGAGGSLIGVTRGGGVLRWREELGWKPVLLEGAAGQGGAPPRAFGVAMADGGRALVLALPEALFASEDGGGTWARAPLPTMGLSRVGALGGELLAEGLLASATWDPRRTPAFSRSAATLPRGDVELDVATLRAPSASAVRVGRAAMSGDRYVEAVRPEDAATPWLFASGPIEGPLKEAALPGTADCGSIKLGANGRRVVAVCAEPDGDRVVARVLRSDDGGGAWSPVATLETPDIDLVGVAVAPEGAALLTGVCKPSDGAGVCKPTAPLLLTHDGAREEDRAAVAVAAAPTLSAPAELPAFSADGRSAYFLGYRGKDERLALFVSHDGGETFAPRSLDAAAGAPPAPRADGAEDEDEDAEGGPGDGPSPEGFDIVEESALRPAEDGAVGLVLGKRGSLTYLTADDDGRVLSMTTPPSESAALAGVGRRVVALAPRARESGDDAAALWESLDGGLSWAELPEMPALSRELSQAQVAIACGASGCLFGDVATRVGWGGQADGAAPRAPEPAPRPQPSARTPIVCETLPSSKWTRVDHVDSSGLGLPDGDEVLRGRSVWSLLTRAPSGAVDVVSAMLPESGAGEARIITRSLLPAVPAGLGRARVATNVTTQMEGYAVARLRIPGGAATPGTPMRNVEIAWENWIDGTSGRGTIPDAGPFELGDVKVVPDATRRPRAGVRPPAGAAPRRAPAPEDFFDPALLSVSLRGLFLRPHSSSAHSALTFLYEPPGRLQRFDFPSWPASGLHGNLDVRTDAVLADGQPVGVGMVRQASNGPVTAMLLAHRPAPPAGASTPGPGAAWAIEAVTVAPPAGRDRIVHTDWTYAGSSIGVTTLVAEPGHAAAWAIFQPFRGDGSLGPAQPLPTPFDLGDPPRPCSAAERAATARHEAPLFLGNEALFPGTRHPVLVVDTANPSGPPEVTVLLTSTTVLHGTPAAPCVAGWEARAIGRAPRSAIIPGDLAHSWLFRAAAGSAAAGGSSGPAVELRPMACRFDPGAEVPEAVWSEPAMAPLAR
ncbi:hypothetical protein [Sorangium sp. So ce1000]|uniref:hypothetical protein n=1 Tax=Sorangium sp. So ce1000 TaxID=3133325 RepID=UPI003F60895A